MIALMSITTFTTQRQLTQKNMPASALQGPMAQQQKMLLYALPLIFAFSGVNFPLGVLIYWTTTNVWSMGQQFYVIRRNPTPGSEAERALKERRARRAAAKGIALEDDKPAIEERPRGQREQPKRKDRAKGGPRPAGQDETGEVRDDLSDLQDDEGPGTPPTSPASGRPRPSIESGAPKARRAGGAKPAGAGGAARKPGTAGGAKPAGAGGAARKPGTAGGAKPAGAGGAARKPGTAGGAKPAGAGGRAAGGADQPKSAPGAAGSTDRTAGPAKPRNPSGGAPGGAARKPRSTRKGNPPSAPEADK